MASDSGALRAMYIPTDSTIPPNTEFREGKSEAHPSCRRSRMIVNLPSEWQ